MTTLEFASQRLADALQTLEAKIAESAAAASSESGPGDTAEIESLRQKYADLNSEYEALLARYENLLEKNLALSDRLDAAIARLKRVDGKVGEETM